MTKDQTILTLRPKIQNLHPQNPHHPLEQFQNDTLRPILKQQNKLLLQIFLFQVQKRKSPFLTTSPLQQKNIISEFLQRDQKFRQFLLGTIVAWFTQTEWQFYQTQASAINKRLFLLLQERFQSQLNQVQEW